MRREQGWGVHFVLSRYSSEIPTVVGQGHRTLGSNGSCPMHDAYIRRNILPVVIFHAGNAHKKGRTSRGTDYMAVVSCRVFAISFSNLGNVKDRKRLVASSIISCLYLFFNLRKSE
jgi:hypothetical protein